MAIVAHGGQIVQPIGGDAPEITARFRDPAGNVLGIYQEPGVRPYIYVEHIDESLGRVTAHGGEVTVPPYPEGDLWVALFRWPARNIIGVWQQGARS